MLKRQRSRREGRPVIEDEEAEDRAAESETNSRLSPTPVWSLVCIALVPLLTISICGSRSPAAMGISLLVSGACMLAITPRFKLPLLVSIPLGLMLLFALGGFLPASMQGVPEWRTSLTTIFGIELPSTVSPMVWSTLQGWLILACGTLWLSWSLARGFNEKDRRITLQILCVGAAAIAIFSIVAKQRGFTPALWTGEYPVPSFGPFTNRNNFSGLLAPAAVLAFACAYDAIKRKRASWILFAVCILPLFAAILVNTSRMGVVLFFLGLGGWVVSGNFASRSSKRLAISASVLLFLAAAFLVYGRQLVEKFTGSEGVVATLSSDGRMNIFTQAASLFLKSPLLGTGLGTFEPVFAVTKTNVSPDWITRTVHPENDALWFGIEAGGLSLIALGFALVVILQNLRQHKRSGSSSRNDRRLRAAAGIGFALLLVQSLVDTPLHTLGLTTLGSLLVGLAWHTKFRPGERGVPPAILRLGGSGFCVLAGMLWLMTGLGHPFMPSAFATRAQMTHAKDLISANRLADALLTLNEVIRTSPMEWDAYFMRAALKLQLGHSHEAALEDFTRARVLEPNHPGLCIQEATMWLDYSPTMAFPGLREAMRRSPRTASEYYAQIVSQLHKYPELKVPLRQMAADPKLRLVYLGYVLGEDFQVALKELLDQHPSLENFTALQKLALFELWYGRGEREALIRELESNPLWRTEGWIVLARHYASLGKFKESCELAYKQITPPVLPDVATTDDLGQLHRAFLQNPGDPLAGLALYRAQRREGQLTEALTTIRDVCRIPRSPASALYEYSNRLAERGDYSRAWEAMLAYRNRLNES